MKNVVFVIALAHLVVATTPAQAEPGITFQGVTVLEDQASLELHVREFAGALVVDLAAGDTCTKDVGDIVDVISPAAGIRAVSLRVVPGSGIAPERTLRLMYKANVDTLDIASSTGDTAYAIPVPEGDEEAWFEYVLEVRDERTATTIASSGYIRVKKLNSGG